MEFPKQFMEEWYKSSAQQTPTEEFAALLTKLASRLMEKFKEDRHKEVDFDVSIIDENTVPMIVADSLTKWNYYNPEKGAEITAYFVEVIKRSFMQKYNIKPKPSGKKINGYRL